jgi:hypothetical protein
VRSRSSSRVVRRTATTWTIGCKPNGTCAGCLETCPRIDVASAIGAAPSYSHRVIFLETQLCDSAINAAAAAGPCAEFEADNDTGGGQETDSSHTSSRAPGHSSSIRGLRRFGKVETEHPAPFKLAGHFDLSPSCWTTPYTVANLRPVPLPTPLVVKKGSKITARVVSSIPIPVSATLSRT